MVGNSYVLQSSGKFSQHRMWLGFQAINGGKTSKNSPNCSWVLGFHYFSFVWKQRHVFVCDTKFIFQSVFKADPFPFPTDNIFMTEIVSSYCELLPSVLGRMFRYSDGSFLDSPSPFVPSLTKVSSCLLKYCHEHIIKINITRSILMSVSTRYTVDILHETLWLL